MPEFKAYAAAKPGGPLKPFNFDPGPLGAEEVEIAVTHCGLCHSDLSMLDNEWGMTTYPLVPGHEAIGTVTALGEDANTKGLKVGQRVGVGWWAKSCLSCRQCLSGDHNLCPNAQGTIVARHGAFADGYAFNGHGHGRSLKNSITPRLARCFVVESLCSTRF